MLAPGAVGDYAIEAAIRRESLADVDALVADLAQVEAGEVVLADRDQRAVGRGGIVVGDRGRARGRSAGSEPSASANVFSERLVVAGEAPVAPPAAQPSASGDLDRAPERLPRGSRR